MKRKIILTLIFFVSLMLGRLNAFQLQEVMKIGSDKQNYEFFLIDSVDVDRSGNIYILDFEGGFVGKYDKTGKFIAKSGRKGNGPGEFMFPKKVFVGNSNVYISDLTLRQLNVFDQNLKFIKTIKLYKRPYNFCYYKSKIILAIIQHNKNDTFIIFDDKGNKEKEFFSEQPYFLKKLKKDKMFIAWKISYAIPVVDYSIDKREIALVFSLYDNHNKIYLIDFNGKIRKEISLDFKENYKIPWFLLKYPRKYPSEYSLIMIDSIHYYGNKYIIVNYVVSKVKKINSKKQSYDKAYLIVIDTETGKIVAKTEISPTIRIHKIKGDYMYVKDFDDDMETLHIYKIEGIK